MGGVAATGYKVYEQWHRVDRLTEDFSSFRDNVAYGHRATALAIVTTPQDAY
ncbi:TPA: hypothetical protein ACH3X1_006887 [Trebouxia sp. C0004]